MLASPMSSTSTGPSASRARLRSAISVAMRSMPPTVRSSLIVAGVYSDAGPTPIRFEWMSLVCRIVNVFGWSGASSPVDREERARVVLHVDDGPDGHQSMINRTPRGSRHGLSG